MHTVKIGDELFEVHDERPADWSMENDYVREIQPLDDHVFRITSWMGRIMFAVEYFGKTVRLPLARALAVSRLIAADEQAGLVAVQPVAKEIGA